MSKIYFTGDKLAFIKNIKKFDNITSTVTFIKKYHNYESYIDFFPQVLKDIIFEYINDIIVVNYGFRPYHNFITLSISCDMMIDYIQMDWWVCLYFDGCRFKLSLPYEPQLCTPISSYNAFMKIYYKKESYIQHNHMPLLTSDELYILCIQKQTHRQFKHESIIAKKIIDCIIKIKIE